MFELKKLRINKVCIDENSYHLKMNPKRLWLKRNAFVPMKSSRGSSVTIIGAIDSQEGFATIMHSGEVIVSSDSNIS